jgi:restriction system protein
MAVPDYQTLMRPVLEALVEGGQLHIRRELVPFISKHCQLSEDDLAQQISSGLPLAENRIQWAVTYLVQAGAAQRPRRGYAEITDRGRDLLARDPGPITNKILDQFPEFVDFRQRSRKTGAATSPGGSSASDTGQVDVPPAELLERAEQEANAALQAELLKRIYAQPPAFLERLVLRLLVAMGYGDRVDDASDHRGRSGDEGVDGVIRQDPLGLDVVYLQAKRYALDTTVGRPEIQAFVGALQGVQASRGVFITTGRFSAGAVEYAERVNARVILIDGPRLVELMLRYRLGVEADYVATLYRVDEDFFDA